MLVFGVFFRRAHSDVMPDVISSATFVDLVVSSDVIFIVIIFVVVSTGKTQSYELYLVCKVTGFLFF